MIKNIVFDFGGVLLDWNPKYLYRNYFRTEEEMDYFLTNIYSTEWNAQQDKGRPFAEGVAILQAEHPEYSAAIQAFGDRWEETLKGDIEEGVELLRQVKALGYKIYGLTNWSAETLPIAYGRYDFFKLFDGIVVSGEEKMIKPEICFYEVLLNRYALKAEECVFIDDNPVNIKAAEEVGIHGILFDCANNVRKELASFGIELPMDPIHLRKATLSDVDRVMDIMDQAKELMKQEGRCQWDKSYPAAEHIKSDIEKGYGYVLCEGAHIAAYAAVVFDGEPSYKVIDGKWLTNGTFVVAHRMAVAREMRRKGIAAQFIKQIEALSISKGVYSFKVDTNHDNKYMLKIFESLGFTYCGIITLERGGQRLAYEKILNSKEII